MTARVSYQGNELRSLIRWAAETTGRPTRAFELHALLHLPAIASQDGTINRADAIDLLMRLSDDLPCSSDWPVAPHGDLGDMAVAHVDGEVASEVMSRFHYLRSPRDDGRHYGLFASGGELVALGVTSPCDVPFLRQLLKDRTEDCESIRVLSRVYCFPGAPRNAVSSLLARLAKQERLRGVRDLLTYVDPNMGFSGASYKASGWSELGQEVGTTYRYVNGRYITGRELARRFGHSLLQDQARWSAMRLTTSRMELRPLLVFHRGIAPRTRRSSACAPTLRANRAASSEALGRTSTR